MKIRLMGTRDELVSAVAQIGKVLEILEASEPYANRGNSQLYRQYLEVRLVQPTTVTVERADTPTSPPAPIAKRPRRTIGRPEKEAE